MSGTMNIRFASDMPAAAVEVLSPELETVTRVMMSPEKEEHIEVPSEASFIRVHLPSGRQVTLRHPGDLNYVVSRTDLEGRLGRSLTSPTTRRAPMTVQEVRGYHEVRAAVEQTSAGTRGTSLPTEFFGSDEALSKAPEALILPGNMRAVWEPDVAGTLSLDGREIAYVPAERMEPYTLTVLTGAAQLVVALPGKLKSVYIRVDDIRSDTRVVSIRVSSQSGVADTVGGYLAQGDYYAAETMAPWADQAEELVIGKMTDPYAAAVGAYLLLRLERYDLMRDWARNLADIFPFLADGCVIWAWQNIRQSTNGEEATKYLLEAAKRGLPLYTEGLRLLSQGLRVIGKPGEQALTGATRAAGRVVWDSPFTARLKSTPKPGMPTTTFDIDFMPTV